MRFVSTNREARPVGFLEAMKQGLAPDGGLYMPEAVPTLENNFWKSLHQHSFHEIAFRMALPYLEGELSEEVIHAVITDAIDFPLKLKSLENSHFVLELFHGPTLAFKDFGARFMARLFSESAGKKQKEVTILVATSGDTGSAVARGFYKVPGVRVCLLYPKGKVSPLQEKQMATLGENITALEVEGVFDDCQRLVKEAFVDDDLNRTLQLSSANSINIARLLPQSFYYAYAIAELQKKGINDVTFSVPSGNFGNLTGGLLAKKMGLQVQKFIAATNVNDVVPKFLKGSGFSPKASVQTISNAMDVGNPSNFVRMLNLYGGSEDALRSDLPGYSYSDSETIETILSVYEEENYLLCPHTAVGYRAASELKVSDPDALTTVTLATAHPIKFRDVIEKELNTKLEVPQQLMSDLQREKKTIPMSSNFDEFKSFLLGY
ncbi:MAG: threonine synthase [Balneolaceae bacterium]|nr:MAG: threonine synthase [Balneolaceae bacterium]